MGVARLRLPSYSVLTLALARLGLTDVPEATTTSTSSLNKKSGEKLNFFRKVEKIWRKRKEEEG
jgi:hypothetical protein